MHPMLRNLLAIIAGAVLGSIVNMGFISISGSIIPPPAGADVTTMEGLRASLPLFEPKHFVFPFLAHAIGTFVGALVAALIAINYKMRFALGIGLLFLCGGIANIFLLPGPLWFNALDVMAAYIPMAWIAGSLAMRRSR